MAKRAKRKPRATKATDFPAIPANATIITSLGEGKFTKRCPTHGLVKVSGGRVGTCPVEGCGKPLESTKGSKPKQRQTRTPTEAVATSANGTGKDTLSTALAFVEACGGLSEAKEAIARLAKLTSRF